ncbi:hypothetical protein HK105_200241 [Polyrhizophydium stewartii]|uniref:Chromosome segregation in meiosis protein n=1 Tax=Polyrhizophydium stewartii TaxID=2732419 RepID=A0ABR4NL25_9FUNG
MPAALDAGADPASPPVRARRPVARLDADRLLGIRGLPELVQRARKLRFKGRGNEDLARIVDMFRIWGAELYPKLGFDSFVDRTEHSESDHDDNVFFAAPTKPSAGLTAASEDRLAQIEDKRKQALARLAARQAERDRAQRDKQRAEREALVAAMIDDAGVFDN